jgi:hypothetical protein
MSLRCRILGCSYHIRAMTGLQELDRLRGHFRREHEWIVPMILALEIRALFERDDCGSWTAENLSEVARSMIRE